MCSEIFGNGGVDVVWNVFAGSVVGKMVCLFISLFTGVAFGPFERCQYSMSFEEVCCFLELLVVFYVGLYCVFPVREVFGEAVEDIP